MSNDVTQSLIEAKAIYQELKDSHVKQAVDYAVNAPEGIDWVVLTNGIFWRIYKVIFAKPVDHELVVEVNFLALDQHKQADLEPLFLFTKESWAKSALSEYYDQKQALSRFSIGAVVLTEPILAIIKRELKRLSPDVKIDSDQIRTVLEQEVLRREIVDCDKAEETRKRIARAANRALRSKAEKSSAEEAVLIEKPSPTPCPPSTAPVSASPPS